MPSTQSQSQSPPLNRAFLKPVEFGYNGNSQIKRDGVQMPFTEFEVTEYLKCMADMSYFAKTYIKIINLDKGLIAFDPYEYQKRLFKHLEANRFSIILASRQSGKSISVVIFLLWYAVFHPEKVVAILANKGATAREMLARVTLALENLPFFLQPGCRAVNKGSLEFSNSSRIIAAATSGSSIRGLSISLLYLDEFAFIENATTFYTSTYPVITSGKTTRVIITSTANGVGNMYHKLWEGAVQGVNEYKPFRVDWYDVPGRDEAWKKQTIANSSPLQFEQEFGNSFHGTGTTLINAETLLGLKAREPVYRQNDVKVYAKPTSGHNYVMIVDTAKGRGQDSSTFYIIDVSTSPFATAAVFRSNRISPLLFPDVIHKYARTYYDAYVVIESNDAGSIVCNGLYYDYEYENMFVESSVKAGAIGVTMTKRIKRIGCSNIKDLIEAKKLEIIDSETISELSTFEADGASFSASQGNHDDLAMCLVIFGWFASTDIFNQMSSVDLKSLLYAEKLIQIEEDVTPVGGMTELEKRDEYAEIREKDGTVWSAVNTHLI